MAYSPQSKTLALLPKFTGFFSLMGSTFIFQDIVLHSRRIRWVQEQAEQQRQRLQEQLQGNQGAQQNQLNQHNQQQGGQHRINRVYHRLVLGLSLSDMVASIVNILSTWPIPYGTPNVYLASGTTQTCTAQGFFNELGNVATPLYNASLCVYYVLVIRDGWTEERIKKGAEPILHFVPVVVALSIAVVGLPLKLYNNSGWLCWIAPYNCENVPIIQSDGTIIEEVQCERGQLADVFRWVHYAIIWSAIIFVTLGMYSIYKKVKWQEEEIHNSHNHHHGGGHGHHHNNDAEVARRGQKSKKVAIQAALFVGALYLTWIFTTITRIYQITTGKNSFPLLVLMAIFFPLQGFFNALVYIRPRYLRCRSRHPGKPWHRLFLLSLYPEQHPIHDKGQNNDLSHSQPNYNYGGAQIAGGVGGGRPIGPDGRRRSSMASFYSMGNSHRSNGNNDDDGSGEWESEDGMGSTDANFSISTVNAKAAEADYDAGHQREEGDNERVGGQNKLEMTNDVKGAQQ